MARVIKIGQVWEYPHFQKPVYLLIVGPGVYKDNWKMEVYEDGIRQTSSDFIDGAVLLSSGFYLGEALSEEFITGIFFNLLKEVQEEERLLSLK